MKKQALLLLAVAFSANASAIAMPTVESLKTLGTALDKNATIVCSATFAAILGLIIYKFYANGGYTNNPGYDWAKEKERESYFMKYGTSFPTQEQLGCKEKEVLPAVVAPVETQEESSSKETTPVQETIDSSSFDNTISWLRDEQLAVEGY